MTNLEAVPLATWHQRAGLRLLTILIAVTSLLMVTAASSDARSRGRRIGVGVGIVGGLLILDKLSRGGESYRSRRWSRRSAERSEERHYRSKSKNRRNRDSDDDQASHEKKRKEKPAREEANEEVKETGSVEAAETKGGESVGQIITTQAEISAAQDHLRFLGYDVPHTTGIIDEKTKAAASAFQTSIGEKATGQLTTDQLRALFVKVSGASQSN